ncbi:unnamed protein product [Bathycoccus prasinos]
MEITKILIDGEFPETDLVTVLLEQNSIRDGTDKTVMLDDISTSYLHWKNNHLVTGTQVLEIKTRKVMNEFEIYWRDDTGWRILLDGEEVVKETENGVERGRGRRHRPPQVSHLGKAGQDGRQKIERTMSLTRGVEVYRDIGQHVSISYGLGLMLLNRRNIQNNQWGGMQSIDGKIQTCNGGAPCSSSNVFDGGKLYSRDGYHCYLKTAPRPGPPPPPSPPSTSTTSTPPHTSTTSTGPDYSYLGEGECRQSDGSYPIKFSKGYTDLSPHTSGLNAHNAIVRCKAKCIVFAWCSAAEVVLRDIWPTPECRLVTDWNAYVVESTNTFQNNQWGGMQSIDGENYQTYCNGGSSPCSSSNVFDGGKLYSRDGYHCYLKTASAPPAPLPPPPSPPSPPPLPPSPPSPPPPPPDLDYSYLGEGECRQSDGSYPIKFSKGYTDLRHTRAG